VVFATVGASAFFLFLPLIIFGFVLPSLGFMFFATGGTVLATLSTVVPVVCFAAAVVLGARVMDTLLPAPAELDAKSGAEGEAGRGDARSANGDGTREREKAPGGDDGGGPGVDPDLDDFDKRLYGNAVLWNPGEVRATKTFTRTSSIKTNASDCLILSKPYFLNPRSQPLNITPCNPQP
jgi:hypothetical protein